jgi:hypothetical protein
VKLFRSFPLIATAILGLIFLGLYKTSNFVNQKVASEKQLSLDSLATNALGSTVLDMPVDSTKMQGVQVINETAPLETTTPITEIAAPTLPTVSERSDVTTEKETTAPKKTETKPKKRTNVTSSKVSTNSQNGHNTEKEVDIQSKGVSETRIHVIVGSYSVESYAKAAALKFEKKNQTKANVIKHKGFFRVSADNFDSEKVAIEYAEKLKSGGEGTLILKF